MSAVRKAVRRCRSRAACTRVSRELGSKAFGHTILVNHVIQQRRDAVLIRGVAEALRSGTSPGSSLAFARALCRSPGKGLKALLAAAPLEGIDLSRERDLGRNVML
jgi:hypothetical protein